MTKSAPKKSTFVVINRDGSLNIHRPKEHGKFFNDLYHYFLSIAWPKFFVILIGLFFISNLAFGLLYYFAGPSQVETPEGLSSLEHLIESFFFSVQSSSSSLKAIGVWSKSLVIAQTYLGMLMLVIVTGLLYARFARPRARVIFSENALIHEYNGQSALVFRVANERLNQIVEARMTLTATINRTSKEGETSRKFYNLKLENDYSPLFALSWTIRHFIDEDSPLYGMTEKSMTDEQVVIFASLNGIDDTFSQTITARNVYRYDEVIFNKRFKDMLLIKDDKVHINLKGINDLQ